MFFLKCCEDFFDVWVGVVFIKVFEDFEAGRGDFEGMILKDFYVFFIHGTRVVIVYYL